MPLQFIYVKNYIPAGPALKVNIRTFLSQVSTLSMDKTSDIESSNHLVSWTNKQLELKSRVKLTNTEQWQEERTLEFVGGMDLSFDKTDSSIACCSFVVCKISNNEATIVHEDSQLTKLTVPYIPGFLAFREIEPCLSLYEKLTINNPELIPQVIIFDGNGILHPQKFGLASHFGVLQNVCTIGAAKNLYQMNEILNNEEHKSKILQLQKPGDHFFIGGTSAIDSLGAALKTTESAKRPIYVSIGHKIDLPTAIWTVMQCCSHVRVPEPTRQADILSRKVIRNLKEKTGC